MALKFFWIKSSYGRRPVWMTLCWKDFPLESSYHGITSGQSIHRFDHFWEKLHQTNLKWGWVTAFTHKAKSLLQISFQVLNNTTDLLLGIYATHTSGSEPTENIGKTWRVIEWTVTFKQIDQPMSGCQLWPYVTNPWAATAAKSGQQCSLFVLWETGAWLVGWSTFPGLKSERARRLSKSWKAYPFFFFFYRTNVPRLQVLFLLSWHCEQGQ